MISFPGRISALELQIARAEGARRDVEFKLTAIHSHMRRTLGIGRDAAANLSSPGRKPQTETGSTKIYLRSMKLYEHLQLTGLYDINEEFYSF